MLKSREELDIAFAALEQELPALIAQFPEDADFWPEFFGRSDLIESGALPAYEQYARERVRTMLSAHGKFIEEDAHS
jgi:hypothetical protein